MACGKACDLQNNPRGNNTNDGDKSLHNSQLSHKLPFVKFPAYKTVWSKMEQYGKRSNKNTNTVIITDNPCILIYWKLCQIYTQILI